MKLTARQAVVVVLVVGAVVSSAITLASGRSEYLAIAVLATIASSAIVLRAVERGDALQRRKSERLSAKLDELGNSVVALSKSVQMLKPELEGDKPAPKGNEERYIEPQTEILTTISEFIDDMDRLGGPNPLLFSQQASLIRICNWFKPESVLTTAELLPFVSKAFSFPVYALEDEQSWRGVLEGRVILLARESEVGSLSSIMISKENRRDFAIAAIVDSDEDLESIEGFAEVVPVDMVYGLKLFYPQGRIADRKFSRLVSYS